MGMVQRALESMMSPSLKGSALSRVMLETPVITDTAWTVVAEGARGQTVSGSGQSLLQRVGQGETVLSRVMLGTPVTPTQPGPWWLRGGGGTG